MEEFNDMFDNGKIYWDGDLLVYEEDEKNDPEYPWHD